MSISELLKKIKGKANEWLNHEVFTVIVVILVGTASFGLGRMSAVENAKTTFEISGLPLSKEAKSQDAPASTSSESADKTAGQATLVGSKNGSKYYFLWCSGAERILEQNRVWFKSVAEARAAGYSPAANCKGLE